VSGATFSSLHSQAQRHLEIAHRLLSGGSASPEAPDALCAYHADLTVALAHLGQTILGDRPGSRPSLDRRMIEELRRGGRTAAWRDDPVDDVTTAGHHLVAAARAVRASADLWSTHHCALGQPRSPEAARLRHPTVIGTAMKHWRLLVWGAHGIARQLVLLEFGEGGLADESRTFLSRYPRPRSSPGSLPDLPLALARPPRRPSSDPFVSVADQVDRVHRHVWELAAAERITAAVLMNVAAIGLQLARAWARYEMEQHKVPHATLALWAEVAAQTTSVRTADPARTVLQMERLDLARTLERCESRSGRWRHRTTEEKAEALRQACLDYARVATTCARAVRSLSKDGALYVTGTSLPGGLITRRPDLIGHKLGDRILPAPPLVARRLEATLHRIGAGPTRTMSGTAA
jgi:hypothetical protein